MRFHHTGLKLIAVVLVALFVTAFAFAQTSRGTITGVVNDPTGAIVPNATVTITNTATGVKRQTTTNNAGVYRFDAVDLGAYAVEARAAGFSNLEKTGITVEAAHTVDLDFNLTVGSEAQALTVEATAADAQLQTAEQVRGGHINENQIKEVPLAGLDSTSLLRTLPGVTLATAGNSFTNGNFDFSVNGQRPRGNNYMIDGVENNDISIAGVAFTIQNPDSIQEVSVQTSNFSAEFGRAGGAVVNQVTKSGTNSLHGSLADYYNSNAFNATSNDDRLGGLKHAPRLVENLPSFTIGGPVVIPHFYNGKGKTFFFAAGQWDRLFQTTTLTVRVPTPAGIATLQSLAPQCPNAALYLQALGGLVGDPTLSPSSISLAAPSATGTCTNSTRAGLALQTGQIARQASRQGLDNNHLIRIDHVASDKQTLSFRWLYDKNSLSPSLTNLPGFDRITTGIELSGTFADTYVLSPTMTNEFRFNYGRIGFNFPGEPPDAFHANLPNYSIAGLVVSSSSGSFGIATNIPQFRYANNWQYQDTVTKTVGSHTLRFGADFLRQLARQHPPFNERGSFVYNASTGAGAATAFANFLDDFGGNGGSLNRQFGISIYHPDLLRQGYFFQDSWKATSDLTINAGLRYENFGTPVNIFTVAAFTGYDPVNFAAPHKVNPDNNNFAPSFGFAWNPKFESSVAKFLLGDGRTVWRGGYQISYDTWFNNLLSNIAGSSPNTLGGNFTSAQSAALPRGNAGFSSQFASITPTAPTKASAQNSLLDPNIRNPYTQRFSLGFQRELPGNMIMDLSYVGSLGRKLFTTVDMNPLVNAATGDRLHPELQISTTPSVRTGEGIRTERASNGTSNYNSLQLNVTRRFAETFLGKMQVQGSYTWSHYLDTLSEVFATDSTGSGFNSVSPVFGGGSHIDYADSDFDRRHVFTMNFIWDVKGPKNGFLGQVLGGWTLAGIPRWASGFPFNVRNGTDRNGDGQSGPDRPDLGNPAAPFNTRAVIVPAATCATGLRNPDNNACVTANDVHFVEGTGAPNARTLRRNALRDPGIDIFDLSIIKRVKISEKARLEYHADIFNVLNTINYTNGVNDIPARLVNGSTAGTFLDFTQTSAPGRTMRMALKFAW